MHAALAIAIKDLRVIAREPATVIFAVLFPIVFGVFFGLIFSSSAEDSAGVRIAIVDADGSGESERFVAFLESRPALRVRRAVERVDADGWLRAGEVVAIIDVANGFGEAVERWPLSARGEITLRADPARRAEAALVRGMVQAGIGAALQRRFMPPNAHDSNDVNEDVEAAAPNGPIRVIDDTPALADRPANAFAVTFAQAAVWALMGCAASFATGLVREHHAGVVVRLRAAPIGPTTLLAGKALACFGACVAVGGLMLLLGRLAFGVPWRDPALLALGLVMGSLAFTGVMVLLAVLARRTASPGQVAWAVILVMAIVGGGMLPLFAMPEWLATAASVSPVKWSILLIEGGTWRDLPASSIVAACAVLTTIAAIGLGVGRVILARTRL